MYADCFLPQVPGSLSISVSLSLCLSSWGLSHVTQHVTHKNDTFFFLSTKLGIEIWAVHMNSLNSFHLLPPHLPQFTDHGRLLLTGPDHTLIFLMAMSGAFLETRRKGLVTGFLWHDKCIYWSLFLGPTTWLLKSPEWWELRCRSVFGLSVEQARESALIGTNQLSLPLEQFWSCGLSTAFLRGPNRLWPSGLQQ